MFGKCTSEGPNVAQTWGNRSFWYFSEYVISIWDHLISVLCVVTGAHCACCSIGLWHTFLDVHICEYLMRVPSTVMDVKSKEILNTWRLL